MARPLLSWTVTETSGVGERPGRWRLSRAGIVNVYQYEHEHEVPEFGSGRLFLRGVNGSGKSAAMNMLLPSLLTARQGCIDAAGEQVGILKSWMLADRSDPPPVGYLWIEFEQAGRHLTCRYGIKANRQSDAVTTWWFVTARRPGIDLHLAEGSAALSADALRAQLEGEEVFSDSRRREYRAEAEARVRVEELAARSEPDPLRLGWQAANDYRLADLIDFAPGLDPASHAPLEAALDASGLLTARVSADGSAQLTTGNLVAVVSGGVASPLSELLTVNVPEHLVGQIDPGLVAELLESISHDVDAEAPTVVAIDGFFRLGGLHGRHTKDDAVHVGVTARRVALERSRREAAVQFDTVVDTMAAARRTQDAQRVARDSARTLRSRLPVVGAIHAARATYAKGREEPDELVAGVHDHRATIG